MTPEMKKAWQRGKLDCRCDRCGFASAATSRCNQCSSTALTYFTHTENGGKCVTTGGPGSAGASNLRRATGSGTSDGKTAPAPPSAVSADPGQVGLGL